MKKLTLELETLSVESFVTGTDEQKIGTVHAFITLYCSDESCDHCNTLACDSREEQCMPTLDGLTCMYETCGACNPTDPNCTTYCPTGSPLNCPTGTC
ncbi:MAG TPA: pinensin family lanthipeptide [Longimicrobium sp.]